MIVTVDLAHFDVMKYHCHRPVYHNLQFLIHCVIGSLNIFNSEGRLMHHATAK